MSQAMFHTRRTLLLGLAASGLSACGFQPRGDLVLPTAMRKVSLQDSQPNGLTQTLTQLLQSNGAEIIISTPPPPTH